MTTHLTSSSPPSEVCFFFGSLAHAMQELAGILSEIEFTVAQGDDQNRLPQSHALDQDFDLACQVIAEFGFLFERLSAESNLCVDNAIDAHIASIRLERLRDLLRSQNAPRPSLRDPRSSSAIHLF